MFCGYLQNCNVEIRRVWAHCPKYPTWSHIATLRFVSLSFVKLSNQPSLGWHLTRTIDAGYLLVREFIYNGQICNFLVTCSHTSYNDIMCSHLSLSEEACTVGAMLSSNETILSPGGMCTDYSIFDYCVWYFNNSVTNVSAKHKRYFQVTELKTQTHTPCKMNDSHASVEFARVLGSQSWWVCRNILWEASGGKGFYRPVVVAA